MCDVHHGCKGISHVQIEESKLPNKHMQARNDERREDEGFTCGSRKIGFERQTEKAIAKLVADQDTERVIHFNSSFSYRATFRDKLL